MALFESILTLLLLAILLLQVSRRLSIPYPTMLALAGLAVAALPWAPEISIEPHLVMALFIAPAILEAAFDFPPSAIKRYWLPLLSLVVVAVLLTTAAVAWVGVHFAGMPIAAAVALGAIVAPPDAAAAAAMLDRPSLPRTTVTILKGESLLNDAVALFIFSIAVHLTTSGQEFLEIAPRIAFAIPGGVLIGYLVMRIGMLAMPYLAGTLGGILFQFVVTFGIWIIADWLQASAILAVVTGAMTAARHAMSQQSARDRIHTNVVWSVVVFLLNVLAFLFVGLQARTILLALDAVQFRHAMGFALLVLLTVVVVRIVWLMVYGRAIRPVYRRRGIRPPSIKQGLVAAWCGMRGMVTLAAALALPAAFPQRDLIVLTALTVVIGTLVVQGITLGPLIRLLRFPTDSSRDDELRRARAQLENIGEAMLDGREDEAARVLRAERATERAHAEATHDPSVVDALRLESIRAQRDALRRMHHDGVINDEAFHALQEELDLSELAASRRERLGLVDS